MKIEDSQTAVLFSLYIDPSPGGQVSSVFSRCWRSKGYSVSPWQGLPGRLFLLAATNA